MHLKAHSSLGIQCVHVCGFLRYTLAVLDATVFPANGMVMKSALETLGLVLNLGPQNLGHIQLPISQSNTTSGAMVKHRRTIEDFFLSNAIDISQPVGLHLRKPADAHASDRRGCLQGCLAVCQDSKKKFMDTASVDWPPGLGESLGHDWLRRGSATRRQCQG